MEPKGQHYAQLKVSCVLVCAISLFNTSVTLGADSTTTTYIIGPLKEMESQYERNCIEASLVEQIRLSRDSDRRRQKQGECTQEVWLKRAYNLVDRIYSKSQIHDAHIRAHIETVLNSSIFDAQLNELKASEIRFQTYQSENQSTNESSISPIDTLKSFKTLTP